MKKINYLAIVASAIIIMFGACKKEGSMNDPAAPGSQSLEEMISEKGQNPDEADLNADQVARHNHGGYLYTESNDAGLNQILVYKQHLNGSLSFEGSTASGGPGSGTALGSQGALVIDKHNRWLFAVNAGDNSVSSFKIDNDGSLTLAHTEPSGGMMPVSLCVKHKYLYVVNSASANICGFEIGPGGTLTMIAGSMQPLSSMTAAPAQISFTPNGHRLVVTEKMTNIIATFDLNGMGAAGPGTFTPSTGMTPFGFDFSRNHYMIVSNAAGGAPGASSCTSYSGLNGTPDEVNGAVPNNQAAACWVATTRYGRFAYVTNTGSDNISSYYVAPWGSLYLIRGNAVSSGDAPIDICVAGNNYYVYNLNSMDHTIGGFRRTFLGGLQSIGTTLNLPPFAAGLAAF